MPINPLGAEVVFDGDNPRTFSARARIVISGGDFVVSSGAATNFSSGADSFVTSDLVMTVISGAAATGDIRFVNGIALNTVGSNGIVTVLTRGALIVRSASPTSGGALVSAVSGTGGHGVKSIGFTSSTSGTPIGRSMSAAGSGTNRYLLVDFHF